MKILGRTVAIVLGLITISAVAVTMADAKGRKGSHAVGGTGAHHKGGHMVGGVSG